MEKNEERSEIVEKQPPQPAPPPPLPQRAQLLEGVGETKAERREVVLKAIHFFENQQEE